MLWIYLAALIVGAGTLTMQAVLGHDGDADADGDHDTEGDGGASLLISTRFWTFLTLAFGVSGALLTLFRLAGTYSVLALATGSGVASGLFASWVIRALRRGQVSSAVSIEDAVGRVAEVRIPCEKGRVGRVRLELRGQTVDLLAMAGDVDLGVGTKVVVEEIEGGIARVSRAPDEIAS